MEWINEPPCYAMTLKLLDPVGGRLELTGPAPSERVAGGLAAAVGATFVSGALAFLRTPIPVPMPFKLVPLTIGLVGSGIGALGVVTATGDASVLIERGKGIRLRWKLMPLRARELFISAEDIAGLEISRTVHPTKDSQGFTTERVHYRLNVVRKSGQAVPIEAFRLHTQARLRQEQLEAVLSPVKARARRTPAKASGAKKTAAPRKPPARKTTGASRTR